jgi:hypothetical protein
MKKLFLGIVLVILCIVFSNITIAQQNSANDTVLTLTYGDEHIDYTLDDLLAFDSITGNGGRLKSNGVVIPPWEYTGVLITTLAQEFPDMSSQYSVVAIADDGYTVSYTYDEILGEVMVYDNEGNEIGEGGVSMIIATMENGETGYDGSLRIAFINQDEPITFSALWAKYVVELVFSSNPPNTPTINGPTSGNAGTEYPYTISTTDPDGDDVYYCIDWGDESDEVCIGPYASGEEVIVKHTWTEKNTYDLRVKAKDDSGAESNWATLKVTMPKTRLFLSIIHRLLELFPILQIFL